MLVLSRKASESIQISGEIIVTVLEIRGGRVRIGIEAPSQVAVHRHELIPRLLASSEMPLAVAGETTT